MAEDVGGLRRTGIGSGMQVAIPAAGVFFSPTGGRIPLCLTYPETFNALVGFFFVLVFLFGGLYFVQGSEPLFGEGFPQTASFSVFLVFLILQCMFISSPLLTTRSTAAFSLLCFINDCIECFQL